ncbi:capsular polysaccharide export protein [Paraburkholderia bannensis]|uniref:Capsular polysaccharide export protein n=1 Tax=Paraburkholderia bannensis TaxID=765414 RepID=A0A7W9WT91_9BURK|nr:MULTISPECIES: capsular biosynthesis protein [Paraburkholderia]MBB3258033.1 capsular polysaccharide export protein [Paraburkholderia sp. WP4_3_2]MBB6103046.1 capsular polysaccharide export protein [Paraburkholderia bannensis]
MARVRLTHALDPARRTPRPATPLQLADASTERVLLIDERSSSTHDSLGARARRAAFARMVASAETAHPRAQFWLIRSRANGRGCWLSQACDALPHGIFHASADSTACATIDQVDRVYTLAAPEGLHALLANVPLHVFGSPWYAGWGITHDEHPQPARQSRPTLAALFDIAFLHFGRYLDPATHTPGTLDTFLDSLELQRQVAARFEALGDVVGVRFQWWKRPFATPYLGAGGHALRWADSTAEVAPHECAALWGARSAEGLASGVRQIRIEDGFLHSLGLGSDMNAPHSQVIDTRGLYFDASRPSDLSMLLNETSFTDDELKRAGRLRAQIVASGLTKYNLGRRKPQWQAPAGKRVVLVPGQVADDASIRLGTRAISTADALLKEVRARRPHAFIVYKPHPDVMSGNRNGLIDAQRLADIVDTQSDVLSLIEASDEIHTLSSLAGFDALLRGKEVHAYGMPFYAGWGLTHDALAPLPWRERTLTLDMLTAGALLRYPLYWDWDLGIFTTPEAIAARLAPGAARPLRSVQGDRWRFWRKARRWTHNALAHLAWRIGQRVGQTRNG